MLKTKEKKKETPIEERIEQLIDTKNKKLLQELETKMKKRIDRLDAKTNEFTLEITTLKALVQKRIKLLNQLHREVEDLGRYKDYLTTKVKEIDTEKQVTLQERKQMF